MKIKTLFTVVLIAALAYSGYWYYIARTIEDRMARVSHDLKASGYDLDYEDVSVSGYPYRFVVEMGDARLQSKGRDGMLSAETPLLQAITQPWKPDHWIVIAEKARTDLVLKRSETLEIVSESSLIRGSLVFIDGALARTGIEMENVTLSSPSQSFRPMEVEKMEIHIRRTHIERADTPSKDGLFEAKIADVALTLRNAVISGEGSPALGKKIAKFDLDTTLRGTRPLAWSAEELAVWRDSGGTLDLNRLALEWGRLSIKADGDFALDEAFRLLGAVTLHIKGADALIGHLAARDMISAENAVIARESLTFMQLAAGGEDQPLELPILIQDGVISAGPIPIAEIDPVIRPR